MGWAFLKGGLWAEDWQGGVGFWGDCLAEGWQVQRPRGQTHGECEEWQEPILAGVERVADGGQEWRPGGVRSGLPVMGRTWGSP